MSEPIAAHGGFSALVRRHDMLFTLLGGLIVFAGFFVKEVVHERSGNKASSISSSKTLYDSRTTLYDISSEQAFDSPVWKDLFPTPKGSIADHDIQRLGDVQLDVKRLHFNVVDIQNHARFVADLLNSLPMVPADLVKEQKELLQALDKLKFSTGPLVNEVAQASKSVSSASDVTSLIAKEQEPIGALRVELGTVNSKAAQFNSNVLAAVDSQLRKQDWRLKWSTIASYCLFSIGWFLGLIGKVLKLPALGGG